MYSAFETGDSLVEDWNEGKEFLPTSAEVEKKGRQGFKHEVEKVGGKAVEWKGWKGIEEVENKRGERLGKEREKIVDIQEMVHIGTDTEDHRA
jgi:adrenodoxin-NADP+ reductase